MKIWPFCYESGTRTIPIEGTQACAYLLSRSGIHPRKQRPKRGFLNPPRASSLVRNQTDLNAQQLWGTLVASAMASRNRELVDAVLAEATQHLPAQALDAAKGAAAIMGMNNIYYRFLHLTSNQKYATIPAKLRMNIRMHGVDQLDFELWSLAVSAINGCGSCVDSHERALRERA